MQQWEYHAIMCAREIHLKPGVGLLQTFINAEADRWNISSEEIMAEAQRLGREGWELVSISSRASLSNSPLASEELWIFKRPVA